jgi:hypothetical protein
MLLLRSCPFKIQKEKRAGLPFTSTDYLSLILISLRIRWTIPLSSREHFQGYNKPRQFQSNFFCFSGPSRTEKETRYTYRISWMLGRVHTPKALKHFGFLRVRRFLIYFRLLFRTTWTTKHQKHEQFQKLMLSCISHL